MLQSTELIHLLSNHLDFHMILSFSTKLAYHCQYTFHGKIHQLTIKVHRSIQIQNFLKRIHGSKDYQYKEVHSI